MGESYREVSPIVNGPVLGLVLLAATAHAIWNLLARRADEKLAFLWCSTLATTRALLISPVAHCTAVSFPSNQPFIVVDAWPCPIASATVSGRIPR